jgi:hypothetical protein
MSVREGGAPVLGLLVDVRFVTETEGAIGGLAKEALVVLAVAFLGDLGTQLRKGRRRWDESDKMTAGFGMREDMSTAGMARVAPLSNIMRY